MREILGVNIHVYAGDVAQTGHVLRALEHGVQQRALLQVDVLHAGHEQRATVVRLDEVAAEPADIVHHGAHGREVAGRGRAELPDVGRALQDLAVRQLGHAIGHVAVAHTAGAEEFIGCKRRAVDAEGVHVEHGVRRVLHGVGDDVDIGVDLARSLDDTGHVHDAAGDVRGIHDAQQAGIRRDDAADLLDVDAAGLRVRLRDAKFLAGLVAVVFHRVIRRRVLEHGRDRALAGAVFQDGADDLEHRLRGSHLRDERAARCAENDVHNVVDAVQLHFFERAGTIVQPLRAVRERLVLCLRLDGRLQAQRTAGIFKEQALAEFRIRIHIVKAILDLRRQCRIKQQTFVEILHGFLLPNVTI